MIIGVDVAKYELALYIDGAMSTLKNEPGPIKKFLKGLPAGTELGLESTGGYGLELAETACQMGFTVYMLAPKLVSQYRRLDGVRAKTDRLDARLIARYVEQYKDRLWPFEPFKEPYKRLRLLSRKRMRLVAMVADLRKCLKDLGDAKAAVESTLSSLHRRIVKLESEIAQILSGDARAADLATIPGVGPVVTAMILPALEHFKFNDKHAFIAYCGMDLTTRESGRFAGQKRISHEGDAYLRWVLFTAALGGCRSAYWKPYYESLKDEKKLKPVQALCALARKIAKVAYGVHKSQQPFAAT